MVDLVLFGGWLARMDWTLVVIVGESCCRRDYPSRFDFEARVVASMRCVFCSVELVMMAYLRVLSSSCLHVV